MKVLFANNFYYLRGGSERVLFDEMALLKAKGHHVAPFSRAYGENVESEYDKYFLPPLNYDGGSLATKMKSAFQMVYSSEAGRRFGEILNDFKPDLVHAHNIYGRLTTAIIDAAAKAHTPAVMTLHDYKLICPSYLMLDKESVCERCAGGRYYFCASSRCHKGSLVSSLVYTVESYFNRLRRKYDYIKYFICPSRFLLEKHAASGMPREKLLHVPNFIDVNQFEPNYSPGRYALYCGRLSAEKGVRTLLRAMDGLEMPLRIVGDGPMRTELEEFARGHGMDNVVFEGYKSGDELKALYRDAAFLAFPSEWYENAPMSILEAFACGKPVIGADIGGIPEMIVEGKTGLLFRAGDHAELGRKMENLFGDSGMISQLGMNARRKVEAEYDSESHYRRLVEVYERALA